MKLTLKMMSLAWAFASPAVFSLSANAQKNSRTSIQAYQQVLAVEFNEPQNTDNPQATQRKEWDAFFGSQYTYWDAKVLSKFWNQDVGEAKARIGRKLLWGPSDQAILDQFLVDARVQALQSVAQLALYAESSYDYDDAQMLATFWGDSTPYDAKLRIERNLILGNEQVVKDALQFASRS
ncbi:MAG: hypothetical protein ACFCU8_04180 [Thermosynechococcaceae cyanobacterium]